MINLKDQLIRLGNKEPSLRKHLRPILDKISRTEIPRHIKRDLETKIREVEKSLEKETPLPEHFGYDEEFYVEILETLKEIQDSFQKGIIPKRVKRKDTIIRDQIPPEVWDFILNS